MSAQPTVIPGSALAQGHNFPSSRWLCYARTLGLLFFQALGLLLLFTVCVCMYTYTSKCVYADPGQHCWSLYLGSKILTRL